MPRSPGMFTRIVSLLLLVFLVFCASCAPQITEQGKRQLRSSAKLIRDGSYSVAADELGKFLEAYPGSDEVGEAHYMIGLCRVHIGQPDRAEDAFNSALTDADVPILEHYARLSLANLAHVSCCTRVRFCQPVIRPLRQNAPRLRPGGDRESGASVAE